MGKVTPTLNLMAHDPVARVCEVAVVAERLGFARCWVYDEGLATRDVYVALSAIALATRNIRIGPGITNPYTRHPGATAAAIASLDELSGGRAFLGIGAGGGMTLGPLAVERVKPAAAVEEAVIAIRRLFAGETVAMDGETVALRDARIDYARPGIEIWVAGRGPRMHDIGRRHGDGFLLSFPHKDAIGDSLARLRRGAGDRPLTVSYSTMLVTDDAQIPEAKAQLTFRIPDSPEPVRRSLGAGAGVVDQLRQALAEGGPLAAAHLVPDEWLDHFVIRGTPQECSAEIRSLAAAHGIDEFQVPVLHLASAETALTTAYEIISSA